MAESLRKKSLDAFLWALIDKLGGSTANFVVTIILARLLMPEDFGLIAMVMVVFEISSSFIQSGFSMALVREKTISEADKSTTFFFNLAVAVVLCCVLYFAAPAISVFFHRTELISIVRVMGLNLIISSLSLVQHALLIQKIDFKTQTKVRLLAVIISGACSIWLATKGYGVWSLVARLVLMEMMSTIFLWMLNPWKPVLQFSMRSFRKLFGFGSVILAEALIDKTFRHLLQILIGKFYTATTLGFFAQANAFCNMAAGNFLQTIQKVTYPILAKLQDDREKLKEGYRQIITMSSFIIIPVMVWMGVLAEPLIITLAGEKWEESVPFLQLLCVAGAIYHFNSINLDVLLVLGRVDLSLRLEIIKKAITALAVIIGIQFGIYGMVASQVVAVFIEMFINTYYTDKFLDYSLAEQAKDIAPTVGFSILTGGSVFLLHRFFGGSNLYYLLSGTGVGMLIYFGLHLLTQTKEIRFLRSFVIPGARRFISSKA